MKQFISNRAGQRIAVVTENISDHPTRELAFVVHGLAGNKEQPHVRMLIEALLDANYSVVSFDTTCTFGESDGNYADATATGYYNDLEDVIEWAADQTWYQERFTLSGHSLGALAVALYAQNYPGKVNGLALLSTVISGTLSTQVPKYSAPGLLTTWEETGTWTFLHNGEEKHLKWAHFEDRLRYDLIARADILTMPTLMIVGSTDLNTPVAHQQLLHQALPEPKEFHVIQGAGHTFAEPSERTEVGRIVKQWAAR